MIVAVVTGSRRKAPSREQLAAALDGCHALIVGDATGVDEAAYVYARDVLKLPESRIHVHYAKDHGDWPECGKLRNRAIAADADRCRRLGCTLRPTAFPCADSQGTYSCMNELIRVGIKAEVVRI